MDRFEFYKELYFKELERKENLNNSLSTPITLITGGIVVIYFFLSVFDFTISVWLSITFILLLSANSIVLIFSSFFLASAYAKVIPFSKPYGYLYMADPISLEDYYKSLIEYYQKIGQKDHLEEISGKDLETHVNELLCEYTKSNSEQNDRKTLKMTRSKRCIMIGFFCMLITTIPLSINIIIKDFNNHGNFSSFIINMSDKDKKTETPKEQVEPVKVEKPVPPRGKLIIEGNEPKPDTGGIIKKPTK